MKQSFKFKKRTSLFAVWMALSPMQGISVESIYQYQWHSKNPLCLQKNLLTNEVLPATKVHCVIQQGHYHLWEKEGPSLICRRYLLKEDNLIRSLSELLGEAEIKQEEMHGNRPSSPRITHSNLISSQVVPSSFCQREHPSQFVWSSQNTRCEEVVQDESFIHRENFQSFFPLVLNPNAPLSRCLEEMGLTCTPSTKSDLFFAHSDSQNHFEKFMEDLGKTLWTYFPSLGQNSDRSNQPEDQQVVQAGEELARILSGEWQNFYITHFQAQEIHLHKNLSSSQRSKLEKEFLRKLKEFSTDKKKRNMILAPSAIPGTQYTELIKNLKQRRKQFWKEKEEKENAVLRFFSSFDLNEVDPQINFIELDRLFDNYFILIDRYKNLPTLKRDQLLKEYFNKEIKNLMVEYQRTFLFFKPSLAKIENATADFLKLAGYLTSETAKQIDYSEIDQQCWQLRGGIKFKKVAKDLCPLM